VRLLLGSEVTLGELGGFLRGIYRSDSNWKIAGGGPEWFGMYR
jgi:hypothetical protein